MLTFGIVPRIKCIKLLWIIWEGEDVDLVSEDDYQPVNNVPLLNLLNTFIPSHAEEVHLTISY